MQSLLLLGLLQVELKFFSFEDVSVDASALSWARRDAGEQMTGVELIGKLWLDFAVLSEGSQLSFGVTRSLSTFTGLIRFFKSFLVKLHIVSLEVPLSEGTSIDEDNRVLHKCLGTNKLIVGRVIDCVQNSGLL